MSSGGSQKYLGGGIFLFVQKLIFFILKVMVVDAAAQSYVNINVFLAFYFDE